MMQIAHYPQGELLVAMSHQMWWQSAIGMPFWLGLATFIVLCIWVAVLYRNNNADRRAVIVMWLCRSGAIGLTLLAIADLTRQSAVVELPVLVIAFDTSQSCSFVDDYDDATWSNDIDDRLEQAGLDRASRLTLAKLPWVESRGRLLRRLTDKYRVQVYSIGTMAKPVDTGSGDPIVAVMSLEAVDEKSEIGNSLWSIVERQTPGDCAGIILFSDGAVTSGMSIVGVAKRSASLGIPFFCVGLGSQLPPPDIELSELQCNDTVLVGDQIDLHVQMTANGFAGRDCKISVVSELTEKVLDSQTVGFELASFRDRVSFRVPIDSPGSQVLRVEAEFLDGEISQKNNQIRKQLNAIQRDLRVLLIGQSPTPEFRFLRQSLDRAAHPNTGRDLFQLNTLLYDASSDLPKIDPTAIKFFPIDLQRLGEYDVVVLFDSNLSRALEQRGINDDELQLLKEYVERAHGSLIMVAGPNDLPEEYFESPINALLPFVASASTLPRLNLSESGFRLELTRLGEQFAPTSVLKGVANESNNLELFRWFYQTNRLKPTALLLGQFRFGEQRYPAITMQMVGSGTVVFHFTDESYRLRYRANVDWFERYWTQLVRHLGNLRIGQLGRTATLTASKEQYLEGESVSFRAEVFDVGMIESAQNRLNLHIEDDRGLTNSLDLIRRDTDDQNHVFVGHLDNLKPGSYTASLDFDIPIKENPVATSFDIQPRMREMIDLRLQREALTTAAVVSGGEYFSIRDFDQLWDKLPEPAWIQIERLPAKPIWSGAWIPNLFALLVLGLLTTEWIMRRRAKMI